MSNVFMEDVHKIADKATEVIRDELKMRGVDIDEPESDYVYNAIFDELERICDYPDYRKNN